MRNLKKLGFLLVLTPLVAACSNGPSESDVEGLIQGQYDQANSMMDDVMAQAGNAEMVKAMSGMIPKLDKVENVSCDVAEGDNTYLCSADVTQTIDGNSRTDKGNFKVKDSDGKWVLTL
ncbi:hypothetical protein [Psychrobacter sp. M13]|uniref:hypothetical protein n=1 Tax=Psychrobacter sp. M13 TaxID=3067275 RepID=UPI00273BD7D4|nr:hypothetical protein [Psychrobacter sp. M13]WLP93979.1 hypothetical protein Q9G97_10355 [Psychrobacter sp. M13]